MPVRIFWPEHLLQPSKEQQEGYLVGWVSNGDTTCVADIVPAGRLKELQEFLTKNERNDLSPQIVGLCGPRRKPGAQLQWDSIRDHAAEFLIRVSLYGRDLIISDMYMRGVPLPHSTSKHVILFQEANSRLQQYYSLDPLILDLSAIDDELAVAKAELKRTAANFRRRQSSFGHGRSPGLIVEKPSVVPMDWNVVLHQINIAYVLSLRLRRFVKDDRSYLPDFSKLLDHIHYPTSTVFSKLLSLLPLTIIWILNARCPPWLFQGTALKDISATAQQIDLRLQQGMFWPQQYLLWRRNPDKLSPLAQARYIGFYNTLWLIANDAIVGVAVGALLLDNAPYLASLMERFIQTYTIDRTRDMIVWLMGSPAGLKLNADLNGILGTLFMELLVLWSGWAQALCPHLPQLIRVISACSVVGVSMSISVFLDLLAIITVHLHLCYIVASKIYYWEVQGLVSMFTLFRGKRKNVEKNRIDSAEYTLDQLLLGTILFALLTFLFPTVAVYYVLFSLIRISVVLTHAVFEIVLAFVNHFPLFAIMLRIKDPRRLPAGIIIDASPLRDAFDLSVWWKSFGSQSEAHATETVKRAGEGAVYMRMKTAPLSYSSIFYQYKYLWTRLRTHYLLTDILNSLFLGRNIQVIPKLQYPTLPARKYERPWLMKVFKGNVA